MLLCYFSFFQQFDRKIIETYKTSKNFSKPRVVFHKICYISHVNVGIMKILKMAKMLFQRPDFWKRLTYEIFISNHKEAISVYSRNICISYIYNLHILNRQKTTLFVGFRNFSRDIFGNRLTTNGYQNVKFFYILQIWKKC